MTTATTGSASVLTRLSTVLAPLAGLVLVLVLAAVTTPQMYTPDVVRIVLFQVGIIGIAALGQTLVLLTGGIDLSISGAMAMTSVVLAVTTGGSDGRLVAGVLLSLAAGLAVGLLNGGLVVLRGVPPFVATFASLVLVQGVVIAWTGGAPSGRIPAGLSWLGQGRVLGQVPVPVVVFALLALAALVVLERTTAGRRVYATGFNPDAARLSGVRPGLVVVGCYVASSLLGVVAGMVNASYIGYVDAALVRSLNLDSIAAAVIGGVALTGGRGRVGNTLLGTVMLAVLLTWLIQLGAGAGARLVVSGAVIVLAVFMQGRPVRIPRITAREKDTT
ncbi:ABC transporter permease [Phycicoccus endophyticus]|uniref:Autoinducer 2 import system permease protein LsrD n=1 Tax=Phycicoccus endophyticus TaxID=1690220 RepID=A0A7G9R209_9MICO|nr:ABC transporter permease [Phycicoccus endophyticus]NHI19731.1 ABC transporter permease [Phycicoccus endophyticus]QNN49634.1 ABC transporter permease [Phycicoccus endophyticus]GGL33504.1 sugar ABC transporter permease [Phycicoccus endophyticus]